MNKTEKRRIRMENYLDDLRSQGLLVKQEHYALYKAWMKSFNNSDWTKEELVIGFYKEYKDEYPEEYVKYCLKGGEYEY